MEVLEKKYADGLLNAATEVFETMIFMTHESVEEVEVYPSLLAGEVIGVLGFTGTRSGVVSLHGSAMLAKTICANMLGMDISEVEGDEDIADSFGELVNMVAGNFKNLWVEDGKEMDLSIPSVAFGQKVQLTTGKTPVVGYAARMNFEAGSLDINLRFTE